jgi:hypothetical protein
MASKEEWGHLTQDPVQYCADFEGKEYPTSQPEANTELCKINNKKMSNHRFTAEKVNSMRGFPS